MTNISRCQLYCTMMLYYVKYFLLLKYVKTNAFDSLRSTKNKNTKLCSTRNDDKYEQV